MTHNPRVDVPNELFFDLNGVNEPGQNFEAD